MTLDRLSFDTPRGPMPCLHAAPHGHAPHAPLLVFLHGGRDCGDDLAVLERTAVLRHAAGLDARPCHVVAPQLRPDAAWTDHRAHLADLFHRMAEQLGADPARIVVAGFSLGGTAAWQLAADHPGRFAGLVAISARVPAGLPLDALAATPARVFHGGFDHKLPPEDVAAHVTALREAGGTVECTLFEQGNHFVDEQAFAEGAIEAWVMARRPAAAAPSPATATATATAPAPAPATAPAPASAAVPVATRAQAAAAAGLDPQEAPALA